MTDYIPKKWRHFINRKLGRKNYIDLVNDKLLATKAIRKRMTADEIWSVTDIHVETKTDTENKGISIQFLKTQLTDFVLVNQRSYGFFGVLKSDLPSEFTATEDRLIKENDLSGRNVSAIWIKNK
ncbi:hypothetical protein [Flavobacterium sp. 3HN19-14]|uniref:hypothetical protein n=1 Tax=Flavobacterium sp. 3HN19-14 TaxID=3448133 RepID=UPI003EE0FAE2